MSTGDVVRQGGLHRSLGGDLTPQPTLRWQRLSISMLVATRIGGDVSVTMRDVSSPVGFHRDCTEQTVHARVFPKQVQLSALANTIGVPEAKDAREALGAVWAVALVGACVRGTWCARVAVLVCRTGLKCCASSIWAC